MQECTKSAFVLCVLYSRSAFVRVSINNDESFFFEFFCAVSSLLHFLVFDYSFSIATLSKFERKKKNAAR